MDMEHRGRPPTGVIRGTHASELDISIKITIWSRFKEERHFRINNIADLEKADEELERQINEAASSSSEIELIQHKYKAKKK